MKRKQNIVFPLSKLLLSVLFVYIAWFKEVFTSQPLILYGTVAGAAVLLFLDILANPYQRVDRVPKILYMYLFFGIYAFISGVFVADELTTLLTDLVTYFVFVLACLECWYISDRTGSISWILWIMWLVAVLCAVSTVFFGAGYYNGVMVTTMSKHNNPNMLGLVMVMGIFAVQIHNMRSGMHFVAALLFTVLFVYVIILSGSRKSFLACLLQITFWLGIYLANVYRKVDKRRFLLSVNLVAFSLVLTFQYFVHRYAKTTSFYRLVDFFSESGTASRRHLYWLAVQYWKESPVFGIGFNQYALHNPLGFYSHSTYAEVLSCNGLIGCFIYFIPLLMLLVRLTKQSRKGAQTVYLARMCLIMYCVELFLGLGQIFMYGFLHMQIIWCLDWISAENFTCLERKRKEDNENNPGIRVSAW